MTLKEMNDFVNSRIESIENKEIDQNLFNLNGTLIQFIPENLINTSPLNWNNTNQKNLIKGAFRRLSSLETNYSDSNNGIVGYTPNNEYFICFKNGIIETFKYPIIIENTFKVNIGKDFQYIKVENLFYVIRDFIDACKIVQDKIYQSIPSYYIFISLVGVKGVYFSSLDKNYSTTDPFPGKNARFEPFILNSLTDNIMTEIINGIHYGVKAANQWKPQNINEQKLRYLKKDNSQILNSNKRRTTRKSIASLDSKLVGIVDSTPKMK